MILIPPIGLDDGCWPETRFGSEEAVAYCAPGFGGRPKAVGDAHMADWVQDVAGVIEAQAAGPADLVGCSLGAMVAQNLALVRPDLVRSLVLACTGAEARAEVMAERAAEVRAVGMEGVLDATLVRWFTPATLTREPPHPGVAYVRRALAALDPEAFAAGWEVVAEHNVTEHLGEIAVPTTCVAADEDKAAPLSRVKVLADGINGAQLETVRGAHLAFIENWVEFSNIVRAHLEWARSG